jgi:predicted metal-binding membrane protein
MMMDAGSTNPSRVPTSSRTPGIFSLPLRQLVVPWTALLILAVLAWVATVRQASGMGIAAGTMGMAFPLFLAMWVTMMAAMMFPSVAPTATLWARSITRGSNGTVRAWRITSFLSGYLIAWAGYGVVAFAAFVGAERLVDLSPRGAVVLGSAIFAVAGLYQLTPLKDTCLKHCRSPLAQLMHYGNFKGAARDLRVGAHHGAYCVGCCWAFMFVFVAVGVMNIAAMAVLAAIIFLEKLSRHGAIVSKVVAVGFIAIAILAPFYPSLLPALNDDGGMAGTAAPGMPGMPGMPEMP